VRTAGTAGIGVEATGTASVLPAERAYYGRSIRDCRHLNTRKMVSMGRVMVDCRKVPSETNCSLTIAGTEEEVIKAAAQHAASVHGHEDDPQLREHLKAALEPAEAAMA
jgi:hypothetical protein